MVKVNLRNFSETPGSRYRSDGENSAEEFRDEWVIPALEEHGSVVIDVWGTEGITSPFLEELFGGLVREVGADNVINKVFPAWNTPRNKVVEVYNYIEEAVSQEIADELEEEVFWSMGD